MEIMKRAASILIVEDSLTQAKRLERLLAENGYTVRVARNGIEGLAAAAEKKPSVVITDVMMPEMDGFEMCRCSQAQMTVEVFFAGQYHKLTADRIQIIDLLLSTFEAAVLQSSQLEKLGGDYRNALEDVKRAQANFQTLMETTGDAVVVVEGGGTVIYVNPAAELLFHKDSAELVGKPFLFPLEGDGGHREVVIDLPNG